MWKFGVKNSGCCSTGPCGDGTRCIVNTLPDPTKVTINNASACCGDLDGDYYFTDWYLDSGGNCVSEIILDESDYCGFINKLELTILKYNFNTVQVHLYAHTIFLTTYTWRYDSGAEDPIDCSLEITLNGGCGTADVNPV